MGKLTDLQRDAAGQSFDAFKDFRGTIEAASGFDKPEGVHQAVDRIRSQLSVDLEDIRNNEYNGTKIKEGGVAEAYESALQKTLVAAVDLVKAVAKNKGYEGDLPVKFGGRRELVDMGGIENQLVNAVNDWLDVARNDLRVQDMPLPLAINAKARSDDNAGITRITDVVSCFSSGRVCPNNFLTNGQAAEKLARHDASIDAIRERAGAAPLVTP